MGPNICSYVVIFSIYLSVEVENYLRSLMAGLSFGSERGAGPGAGYPTKELAEEVLAYAGQLAFDCPRRWR